MNGCRTQDRLCRLFQCQVPQRGVRRRWLYSPRQASMITWVSTPAGGILIRVDDVTLFRKTP